MSYCQVSDILTVFPRFVENQSGSIQDATIQNWIDDAAGVIHATFLARGLDVNNLTTPLIASPTTTTPLYEQTQILRGINVAYVVYKLAEAIWNTLTPTEQALARGQYNYWETSLKRIREGFYDKEFYQYSSTIQIQPVFGGIGGAETPRDPDTRPEGNRLFSTDMVF